MRTIAPLLILALSLVALGDVAMPPDVQALLHRRDNSVAAAKAEYDRQVLAANRELVAALKVQLTATMKAGTPEALEQAKGIQGEIAKAVAQSAAGEFVGVAGKWTVRFSNGSIRSYIVSPNGNVVFAEENRRGVLSPKGAIMLLDFRDGHAERLTFTDERVFVEHVDKIGHESPDQVLFAIGWRN